MRCKRVMAVMALTGMLAAALPACKSNNGGGSKLPTLAPTPTKIPITAPLATPTTRPDINNTTILELNCENYNDIQLVSVQNGKCEVSQKSYKGDYSFSIVGRDEAKYGVTFDFRNDKNEVVDVVGKTIHFVTWVYQETGATQEFELTLNGKKSDNSKGKAYSQVVKVSNKKWTKIETDIDVYSNVKSPSLNLAMTSNKDMFAFDEVRITYDPNSVVGITDDFETELTESLYFTFEDKVPHFTARGESSKGTVVSGGYNSSNCLKISNRATVDQGVQLDMTQYHFNGKKIYFSFAGKHKDSGTHSISCSLVFKTLSSSGEQFPLVVKTDMIEGDTWVEVSGSYTIPADVVSLYVYFGGDSTQDLYIDNICISTKEYTADEKKALKPNAEGAIVIQKEKEPVDTTGFELIHDLNGEDKKHLDIFMGRSASTRVAGYGKDNSKCYEVSGRTAEWNGAQLGFTKLGGDAIDVIGKEIYVSCWVRQNSGSTQEFSVTLQVVKPDGNQAWPDDTRVQCLSLKSGEWTYIEGIIPIYSNITDPLLCFEMPTSKEDDFFVDDIKVMYNPKSSVSACAEYTIKEKQAFTGLMLTFDDNKVMFEARGDGKPSLFDGGHNSKKSMYVSGRNADWHGVQADLSNYDLTGKTVDVSYWVYHDLEEDLPVACKFQVTTEAGATDYLTVVEATPVKAGKWAHYTNSFTFAEDLKTYYLYFEASNPKASFYIDDVYVTLHQN